MTEQAAPSSAFMYYFERFSSRSHHLTLVTVNTVARVFFKNSLTRVNDDVLSQVGTHT